MKYCSRTIALNSASVGRCALVPDTAQPANGLEPALVDGSPRHADIEQRANGALAQAAGRDARFQLGDPRLQQFAMQRHLCRLALRPRIRRIDADRGLQQWMP